MGLSFGARLRLQREQRNVSLSTVAEITKIKLSLLQQLEADDLSYWPTGVFARSYLRAYAKVVGLDADALVREFLELHPEPEEDVTAIAAARGIKTRPPSRLGLLIESAVGSLRGAAQENTAPPPDRAAAVAMPAASPHAETAKPQGAQVAIDGQAPTVNSERVDFAAVAALCTDLAQVAEPRQLVAALEKAAQVLDAVGIVLWVWNRRANGLVPAAGHGYPETTLAQWARIEPNADNAIGLAFRHRETRVIASSGRDTGAVVVPLLIPSGCAGVLSVETFDGAEQHPSVRAAITIVAAQLATLVAPDSIVLPRAASG